MALAKLGVVVLDCPDPRALAGFYAEVLGGTVEGDGDWVDLKMSEGPSLAFQAAPGHVPPKWPAPDDSQPSGPDRRRSGRSREGRARARRAGTRRRGPLPHLACVRRSGGAPVLPLRLLNEEGVVYPSSSPTFAEDGSRRCWTARAVKSALRRARCTLPQVSRARSVSDQPREKSSAIRRG